MATTNDCGFEALYDDIKHCGGEVCLPGVRSHFYFVRRADIVSWPQPPVNTGAGAGEWKDDFELAADKTFITVDLVPGESELKTERVGAWGGYHFNNTASLVIPGNKEKVMGMVQAMVNDDCVFVVPDKDGRFRLFGNQDFVVDVKPSAQSGKGSGDSRTTTIELSDENRYALPFYKGKITTTAGTLDRDEKTTVAG